MEGVNKIINIVDSLTTYINKSIETLPGDSLKMNSPDARIEILLECINVHLKHIKNEAVSLKMDLIADDASEESTESSTDDNFGVLRNILQGGDQKEDKPKMVEDIFKLFLGNVKNNQEENKPILDLMNLLRGNKEHTDQVKLFFEKMLNGKL